MDQRDEVEKYLKRDQRLLLFRGLFDVSVYRKNFRDIFSVIEIVFIFIQGDQIYVLRNYGEGICILNFIVI